MSEEITLFEFRNDVRQQVNDFVAYWTKSQGEQQKQTIWPDKMSLEEWQDHFFTYLRDDKSLSLRR